MKTRPCKQIIKMCELLIMHVCMYVCRKANENQKKLHIAAETMPKCGRRIDKRDKAYANAAVAAASV